MSEEKGRRTGKEAVERHRECKAFNLSPASAMPAWSLVSLIWIDQERNTKEASFWVSDQNTPGVFLDLFTHKFF